MQEFSGKTAVLTGGGTGMGRELCIQLMQAGCHVAACDVMMDNLEATKSLAEASAAAKTRMTIHECDVSSETSMQHFHQEAIAAHGSQLHLLFNNAGIAGGGSFVEDDRADWERTFAVCWYGVYYGCRTFLPNLIASDAAHIVNISSINGFWATIGPSTSHTAYSAAKFAVKGFSEALITDLRITAPHIKISVVMPGHIGTSIAINSAKVMGKADALNMDAGEVRKIRARMMKTPGELSELIMNLSDDQLREVMHQRSIEFRDNAPTTAATAASIILDGVRAGRWRILVGEDAQHIDERVRQDPEGAYEPEFVEAIMAGGDLQAFISVTK